MDPWVSIYAPKSEKELIGQQAALEKVRAYVQGFKKGKKPLLLAGPTGIGKTSLAHIVATELDCEILEINASDVRNKAAIEQLIGAAAMQMSLFFKKRIILVDEVDGVSGTQDRGGITAVVDIVAKSAHPMIFTATDAQDDRIKPLRKIAEIVTLEIPSTQDIAAHLQHIAKEQRLTIEPEVALRLAGRSGGDIRAAITDLQSLCSGTSVTKEDVDMLSDREMEQQLEKALALVLKTTQLDVARNAFEHVNEDPDRIMLWLEENLPKVYAKPQDLARAMDALADADKFFGRVRKWQYYRYYVYVYSLLSAGIALAKEEKYPGVVVPKQPSRLLTIWMYNQKNAKRKRLAEQLSSQLHTSKRRVVQDVLPYLRIAAKRKGFAKELQEHYNLDEEACEWLVK